VEAKVQRLGRRRFLAQLTGLGVGAYAAVSTLSCRSRESTSATPDAAPEASSPALLTFNAATFATLSAICERILPRDEDPGATDLGVPTYIDHALATPDLASIREVVLRVLPLVDRQARTRFDGKGFHETTPEQQDEILSLWEKGHDGGQHFFPAILSLTMEGAFGDPKYGGNVGGRGFDMIGFRPDPPLHKMSSMSPAHAMPSGTP
jgi:gluconate 2-dehydrogenase gamma chain